MTDLELCQNEVQLMNQAHQRPTQLFHADNGLDPEIELQLFELSQSENRLAPHFKNQI